MISVLASAAISPDELYMLSGERVYHRSDTGVVRELSREEIQVLRRRIIEEFNRECSRRIASAFGVMP